MCSSCGTNFNITEGETSRHNTKTALISTVRTQYRTHELQRRPLCTCSCEISARLSPGDSEWICNVSDLVDTSGSVTPESLTRLRSSPPKERDQSDSTRCRWGWNLHCSMTEAVWQQCDSQPPPPVTLGGTVSREPVEADIWRAVTLNV